jgi:hypothetical protein
MPFARGIDHVANFLTSRSNAIATCLKILKFEFSECWRTLDVDIYQIASKSHEGRFEGMVE